MSYNYLPLDRKPLNFQQVKNLLDYDQLVSITFDAHERILQGREQVEMLSAIADLSAVAAGQNELLQSTASGTGSELPADIVKLMLMLKIKSLSYGQSGVRIETVKRLMELYNNGIIPVVYGGGITGAGEPAALSHLTLPLIGLGEVRYQGQKQLAARVIESLNWQPLQLGSYEANALRTGSQFTTAVGLFTLKKTEHLLRIAGVISSFSFSVFECAPSQLAAKTTANPVGKGQAEMVETMMKYQQPALAETGRTHKEDPIAFNGIPAVHGAVKDQFDYALKLFLQEVNSVTENQLLYQGKDLSIGNNNASGYRLRLAIDQLSLALAGMGDLSSRRTGYLLSGQRGLPPRLGVGGNTFPAYESLHNAGVALAQVNKQLVIPASVDATEENASFYQAPLAGTRCLQLIEHLEKIFAIELIIAVQAFNTRKPAAASEFYSQLVADFSLQTAAAKDDLPRDAIMKAIGFTRAL